MVMVNLPLMLGVKLVSALLAEQSPLVASRAQLLVSRTDLAGGQSSHLHRVGKEKTSVSGKTGISWGQMPVNACH